MSFREKQTSATLVAILLVYGVYFSLAWRAGPLHSLASATLAVIAVIVVQVISQSWLTLRTRAAERTLKDERETRIDADAARVGYFVLLSIVLLGSWVMLAAPGRFNIVDAGLGAVVVAEIARYGAFLVLVRRGG